MQAYIVIIADFVLIFGCKTPSMLTKDARRLGRWVLDHWDLRQNTMAGRGYETMLRHWKFFHSLWTLSVKQSFCFIWWVRTTSYPNDFLIRYHVYYDNDAVKSSLNYRLLVIRRKWNASREAGMDSSKCRCPHNKRPVTIPFIQRVCLVLAE